MPADTLRVVAFRVGALTCALPVEHALEVMRMRPLTPVDDMSPAVLGLALVRGAHVPVVDVARLLGTEGSPARLLAVRAGDRVAALAVDGVIGVTGFERASLEARPPLLATADAPLVQSLARKDRDMFLVLDGSRVVGEAHAER